MLSIRILDGVALKAGGEELLSHDGFMWVDVVSPDEATMARVAERFNFHRLEVEDCLHLDQRPKLEEYPGHQFLVVQGFSFEEAKFPEVALHELHLFVGDRFVVSVHENTHPSLDSVAKRLAADPVGTLGRGPDYVAYMLTDALADANFPVLDRFAEALDDLEERIFSSPDRELMHVAFKLKRSLALVRRVLSPQRDVVGLLARGGVKHVQEKTTLYFRDVYDHLVRLYEQIDAARDLVGNAMDAYLSVVANRTNDITKQLTIFASIFMPLGFVAGFFGQNFDTLGQPIFFRLMLGIVVAVPVTMIAWFGHKRWL